MTQIKLKAAAAAAAFVVLSLTGHAAEAANYKLNPNVLMQESYAGSSATAPGPLPSLQHVLDNSTAISGETVRAQNAESALGASVTNETTRAEAAESALGTAATNASNITSGTLPNARMPAPGPSALGGVTSVTGSNVVVTGIPTNGTPTTAPFIGTNAGTARDAAAAIAAEGAAAQKANNLSDLANASTARANLGLGSAATQNTSAFDAAGTATTAASTIPFVNLDISGNPASPTAAQLLSGLGANTANGPAVLDSNTTLTLPKGQYINQNPYQYVCPAANCSYQGFPTTTFLNGSSVLTAATGEALSTESWYVNTGSPNGQKPESYVGAVQGPSGGSVWNLNTDIVRNGVYNPSGTSAPYFPGWIGSSMPGSYAGVAPGNATIGYELDYTNWDKDILDDMSTGAGSFGVGMYLHNQSRFAAWAGLYLDSHPQDNYGATTFTAASWASGLLTLTTAATQHGIQQGDYVEISGFTPSSINGEYFAQAGTGCTSPQATNCATANQLVIPVASNPGTITTYGSVAAYNNYAWHNGVWLNGAHIAKDNSFLEGTNASNGYQANGSHSSSDFFANGSSAYGFLVEASHTTADYATYDSAPTAISIHGTHSTAAIDLRPATSTPNALLTSSGENVCMNGTAGCWVYVSGTGMSYQPSGTSTFWINDNGNLNENGTSYFGGTVNVGTNGANYLTENGANPTFGPTLTANGSDTNIALNLTPKGTGSVNVNGAMSVAGVSTLNGQSYYSTTPPPVMNLYSSPPPLDWAGLTGGGARFSFDSIGGHATGDTDRGSLVIQTTSATMPPTLESVAWFEMDATMGYSPPWATATTYAANTYIAGSDSNIFINPTACTSGAGPAPSGTGAGLSDGGCTWNWISRGAGNNKVGLIINNKVEAPANGLSGGGSAWGQSNELTFMPGAWPQGGGFATGYEFDSNNNMRDCPPATVNACAIYGVFLNGNGNYLSSFGLTVGGTTGFHRGIYVFPSGASDDGIWDAASSTTGIQDSGAHSGDALLLSGSGANGINITGTYSGYQINGQNGFNVTASGNVNANNYYTVGGTFYRQSPGNITLGNSTDGAGLIVRDPGGTAANYLNVLPATTGFGVSLQAKGSDTNVTLNLTGQGTGTVDSTSPFVASSTLQVSGNSTLGNGSANYLVMSGAGTGFGPSITPAGSDTNIALNLYAVGTQQVKSQSPLVAELTFDSKGAATIGDTSANYMTFQGNGTGFGPTISATGSDTNVQLNLQGKGTGGVDSVSQFIASAGTLNYGHEAFTGTAPTVSNGTLAGGSQDPSGEVTEGSLVTSVTITFHTAFSNGHCTVTSPNGAVATSYTDPVSTSLTINHASASGDQWVWKCN
jgi:hypothetical protein